MPDITAQVAAKGCTSTGITEELAVQLHAQLGKKVLAVVELVSETRSEKRDGTEKVGLSILTIEPAPTPATEDHLRELARSFHYERKLADGQLQIETSDDLEPTVKDVLAAGQGHLPHDFLNSPEDADTCDICGDPDESLIHHVDNKTPAEEPADPFEDNVTTLALADLTLDEDPQLDDDPAEDSPS